MEFGAWGSVLSVGLCMLRCAGAELTSKELLGGSWDLVSRVIGTLIGVRKNCNYSCPISNPTYSVPPDPLSSQLQREREPRRHVASLGSVRFK